MWLFPVLAMTFIVLGLYGGMCAISRYMRGYTGFFIFGPMGGLAYLLALVVSAILFFKCMYVLRGTDSILTLFLFAMLPFAIFGHVLWAFGLVVALLARAAGPSDMPVTKTFDKGDGLMARGLYAEAEAQFRRDLAEHPDNTDVFLRVCRALEASGRLADAARELGAAHLQMLERRDELKLAEKQRQERLLRVTYALGDALLKQDRMDQARQLYEDTLQVLYGYKEADPLRDRLKALEEPGRMNQSQAVERSQPERLQL